MQKDKNQLAFDILIMAKELVINEYTDQRANIHNKWLADSELLWKTRKLRLHYPVIPPYPTEKDILNRAKILLDFLKLPEQIDADQTLLNIEAETQLKSILEDQIIQPQVSNVNESNSSTNVVSEFQSLPEEFTTTSNVETIIESVVEDQNTTTDLVVTEINTETNYRSPNVNSFTGRILPSVLKKIEEMKINWKQ